MPRQLVQSRVPVDLSIVEFNLDAGEDVFLTYTWERREGPEIRRTGKGPPYMELIGGEPGQMTSHAFGLRLGTWLIQEDLREEELREAQSALADARRDSRPRQDLDVLEQTVRELAPGGIEAHDTVFSRAYPGYEIVGHQGCGDLTMNAWNVGFFNCSLGQKQGDRPPTLVCLPDESTNLRTYTCLIKWKGSEVGLGRLTIEEAQFRRQREVRETNEMVWVRYGGRWLPRGDRIEFAVSNQQVIRNGELVPIVTSCHQFGDLRHLLQMPNLNPAEPLYQGETPRSNGKYLPRDYFNTEQFGDIWFGEEAFLRDASQNLLRGALAGPVFIAPPPGASVQRLRGALSRAGYREAAGPNEPLMPGSWRHVKRSPQEWAIEIHYKRNTYGWTMVGLSPDNRRVLTLACTGRPGVTGYPLEEAADLLRRAGARDALLMDEGADVFQKLRREDGKIVDTVPRLRRRLRATFIFGRPSNVSGCEMRPPLFDRDQDLPPQCEPRGAIDHRRPELPPRDQGPRPTCVAFAGAAAREYLLTDTEQLSPEYLYFWCKDVDGWRGLDGTSLRAAERVLIDRGVCREVTWPYNSPMRVPPPGTDQEAVRYRILGFVNLFSWDRNVMLNSVKCWLDLHGPVLAAVWVYQGWHGPLNRGRIPIPQDMEVRIVPGGHAVCIVGYDDQEGCFVFKNSWGTGWGGDGGYGHLSYGYVMAHCLEALGVRAFSSEKTEGSAQSEGGLGDATA